MDRLEAIKTMQSKKPQTSARLLRAIKALGKTKDEIKQTLVDLGFNQFDQGNNEACPVCAYLLMLGFRSPYVDMNSISCNGGEGFLDLFNLDTEMRGFQSEAATRSIQGLGGYRGL